ncbi:MAG: ABC transporter permease [Clostridia bacterium BRH_c25]|nr:MAG: ABC transporter permease [Clostridia bacterium BRH_c25]
MRKEAFFEIIRTLVAILVALLLAFILVLSVSKEPWKALSSFLTGPLSTPRHFGNVVEMTIPLMFTSLAVCVMFQAKQFNLGTTGSFFIGAVAATIVAINIKLPIIIHPAAAILFGGIAGSLVGTIPAILKSRWNASELVSSLMLNYIMLFLGLFIINFYLRDVNAGAMVSYKLEQASLLPKLIPKTRIHFGLILALLMVAITYLFLYRTKWGYALRITGQNIKFAEYSGINTLAVILYSQIIGGFIAGIGGATELLGMYTRFQWQSLPGYGWDGVIVAILARNNPLYVPIAAFFLAYLRIGADIMSRMTDVQSEVVTVIQGIMIMLIAAERFLSVWRHRMIVKGAKQSISIEGESVNG